MPLITLPDGKNGRRSNNTHLSKRPNGAKEAAGRMHIKSRKKLLYNMKLLLISASNTHHLIDATGWSSAVKDAALRRIGAKETPEKFDCIELNVGKASVVLVDNSTVKANRHTFQLRKDAATVLYTIYKDMFLPEIQAAEVAAFSERNVAAN